MIQAYGTPACCTILWPLRLDMLCCNTVLSLLANMGSAGTYRHDKVKEHAEFIIDETFGVPGVGTVIAGTVKRGVITTNANLMLGPDVGDGTFKPTAIKSIQYKRLPVTRVGATRWYPVLFMSPASPRTLSLKSGLVLAWAPMQSAPQTRV